MLKDFRDFVLRGNVLDLAVGIVFGAIVNSLVKDIIMPLVGFMLGVVSFSDLFWVIKAGAAVSPPYDTLAQAQSAGALTFNYGLFLSSVIAFLVVATSAYSFVRLMKKVRRILSVHKIKPGAMPSFPAIPPNPPAASAMRYCPHCSSAIDSNATRCPYCISPIKPP